MHSEIIIFIILGVLLQSALQLLIWKFLLADFLVSSAKASASHETLIANTERILEQQRQIMIALNLKPEDMVGVEKAPPVITPENPGPTSPRD